MTNHDEHYKGKCFEPVEVMESILLNGVPDEYHVIILQNFRSSMAFKYQSRLNLKDEAGKELQKAENWLHRAKTGEWLKDEKPIRFGGVEVKKEIYKTNIDGEPCYKCENTKFFKINQKDSALICRHCGTVAEFKYNPKEMVL